MSFEIDKFRLTPEMLEEIRRKERAEWRARQPTCVRCDNITGRPRQLHCTTCGDVFKFCRNCVAEPAGDVFCPWCADAYASAAEK